MRFRYGSYEVAPTPALLHGILYRPEVPITIGGPSGDLRVSALLDTGADETILPRSLADELGISIDDDARSRASSFGGNTIDVAYGEAAFTLTEDDATASWSATVGFVSFSNPEMESIVLGHAGFLEFFRTCFDGEQRVIELEATATAVLSGVRCS